MLAPLGTTSSIFLLSQPFKLYANLLVKYTFELGGVCVTADYGLLANGTGVSVHNAQNFLQPNGTTTIINGQATAMNASEPGKLTVTFDPIPFPGSYWIVKLGPVEDGEYQYSVVTDAYAITLFILARDPATFKERYEKEVLEFVNPLFAGFLRKPRPTVQGPDCLYSPVPSVFASGSESENVSVYVERKGGVESMVDESMSLRGHDAMAEDVARLHGALRAGGPK